MSVDADRIGIATANLWADITREIGGFSPHAVGFGGYSDIYTAVWHSAHGVMKVAVKVIRIAPTRSTSGELPRALRREISVWKRLLHPNIHVLCGFYEGIGSAPALVSPWYENGDINEYMRQSAGGPDIGLLKLKLFADVATGLKFLHDHSIVHGDIKGGNVLISDDGVARLCDFGLSRLLEEHSQPTSTSNRGAGTARWMAPELHLDDGARRSPESDIWALGCLVIEVWSSVTPYHTMSNDMQLMHALDRKQLPARPPQMPDEIWSIVLACCNFDVPSRPTPFRVGAYISLHLMVQRGHEMVKRGHAVYPLELPLILGDIYANVHAANSHQFLELSILSGTEFVTEIVRILAIHITMLRVHPMIMLGHTFDPVQSLTLGGIHASLRAADSHYLIGLSILSDTELVTEIVRILAIFSLSPPGSSSLLKDPVFEWLLDEFGTGSLPLPPEVIHPEKDNHDFDKTHMHEPEKLRPLARLVERGRPDLVIELMTQFATPALGPPLRLRSGVKSVAWLQDGVRIVVGCINGDMWILDVATGVTVLPLVGHTDEVNTVVLSPNGELLASCSNDQSIRLWDVGTGLTIGAPMVGHTHRVYSVAFSPDGRHLVSGSLDHTIRVWSTTTGTTVLGPLLGHTGLVCSVAYSPDGSRVVSGSADFTVRVWDTHKGQPIMILRGHTNYVRKVVYSPDCLRIVSGADDHTILIWDTTTGRPVRSPLGHCGAVSSISYSPDGTRIVSSDQTTIRIWDAATGATLARINGRTTHQMSSVALSPDGKRLASASWDFGTVRIWDATDDWMRWDM